MNNSDTICAIATAQGGAIGIIRISGSDAISIADKIFQTSGKPLSGRRANSVVLGRICSEGGEVIDEVLATIFRAPHSYTGEDSVEISCHGSQYILQQVMQLLIDGGCRQAERGEYTQRAFLNGKMDLSQAEAVADLIASSSEATHRMAMSQMRGDFSRQLSTLREKLLKLTSLMELELDFADHEELEFADRSELKSLSREISLKIGRLVSTFSLGNALKNGVPVAIVGDTNAGKSTLLNALVGDDRAIVSPIHGTTRDVIEDTVNLNGILFRFIDTAGIRQTNDQIESLGIERTFKKIDEAQIILWVVDATCALVQINKLKDQILQHRGGKKLFVILNKSDLINPEDSADKLNGLISDIKSQTDANLVKLVSLKYGNDIDSLRQSIADIVDRRHAYAQGDVIVSNLRHYEALTRALDAIHRVEEGLSSSLPTDLITQDLRDCLSALADITGGEITTEETLSNIFSHFCVGK